MAKETKSLPEAIKLVVEKNGKIVVGDILMVNIISDIVDLEDGVAVKTILKDVIYKGYGKKMLLVNHEQEDIHLKIKSFAKEISSSYGYKDIIVQYVLYSLAYGLGWIDKIPYIKTNSAPQEKLAIKNSYAKPSHITAPLELTPKRQIPFWSVVVLAIIFLIGISYLFRYMAASTDREQFNERIFTGDSFMYSGEYENAVDKYKEAYQGYNALNSGGYKEDALESMEALNQKLIDEGKTNNKSLLEASKVIKSELQLNMDKNDKEKLQKELEEVETLVEEKTLNGRQQLITNISANSGKLDESGKALLNELLMLSPDDYWLNFIKKKSNE